MSGYYFITEDPTRVYCGMSYTGSSCLNIYNNNPETGNKSGYYHLIQNRQVVKKSAALKKAMVKKICEIQGGSQEMAMMVC